MSSEDEKKDAKSDVALITGRTPDGEGLRFLRRREDRLELGEAQPLKHGRPINGEVVRFLPRKEFPLLCDVKVELEVKAPVSETHVPTERARSGPAQVATDDYRRNWDAIFQRKTEPGLLN